jgi:prophage antirepressor-like protein
MYAADMELMQHNFYQWIADELEPEVANGYFTQQKKKDWENKETDELEWVLKGNIKNQIQDEIFFEKAIKD